ncbi:MAG: DUF411 domain-containing protein [Halobacteriales archaeon]
MTPEQSRRAVLRVGGSVLTVGLAGCLGTDTAERWDSDVMLAVADAHQFSAPGCSCCERYAPYLRAHLETPLAVSVPDDIASVKQRYGIPEGLRSCHTVVLDDHVVEGHVPVTVIARLLDDDAGIDGVALPGMPAGSPGMGGAKAEPFTFYVLGGGRTGAVYARV